jgi:hypothetical protein
VVLEFDSGPRTAAFRWWCHVWPRFRVMKRVSPFLALAFPWRRVRAWIALHFGSLRPHSHAHALLLHRALLLTFPSSHDMSAATYSADDVAAAELDGQTGTAACSLRLS